MRQQVSKLRPSRCLCIHVNNLCVILAMEIETRRYMRLSGKWVSSRHSERP